MLSDVGQDARQATDPEGGVARDRDVMLAAFGAGQPEVAAGLTSHPVAKVGQGLCEIVARRPAAVSRGDNFLADEVEAYDPGGLPVVKVAADCVSDVVVQVV